MAQVEQTEEGRSRIDLIRITVVLCLLAVGLMVLSVREARAEVSCYKTPAQAALQVGEQEGGGYRLEVSRRDAFDGKIWAKVRSCAHPEWPAVIVTSFAEPRAGSSSAAVKNVSPALPSPDVVAAGKRVLVLRTDALTRIEMVGITQAGGRVGDRIWVRILSPGNEGEQRLLLAVVRSAELLEMEN